MTESERRLTVPPDRRRVPRGGRRETDTPGRYPTVLVADGYDDARSPIARYLQRYGFHVVEATNAAEASALAAEHRPQIILSGLHGSSASSFYDRIAPSVSHIVVVLLSGIDEPVPPQATMVIEKPFSLQPMLEALRRALRVAAV